MVHCNEFDVEVEDETSEYRALTQLVHHVIREEVGPQLNLHEALPNPYLPPSQLPPPPLEVSSPRSTMMSARVARTGLRAAQQFSVARPAFNGLRTYATPAQDVRPPVALFGVDGTYASALVCLR